MLVKVLSHALASGADYEKTLKTRRNLLVPPDRGNFAGV